MLPRKRGREPWRKSLFSKDGLKLEEGWRVADISDG
jgi:hypothetical protein